MNIQSAPWAIGILILTVFIQLFLAFGVYSEAEKLKRNNEQLVFLGSLNWFLLTIIVGVPAAALFWFVHYSNMGRGNKRL
jgi:uncharacterized membrane protein YjfL (UPF0719 family)